MRGSPPLIVVHLFGTGGHRLEPLSRRQQEVVDYIRATVIAQGYPPTVRDIGEALQMKSPATVYSHLSALVRKGWLQREAGKPRAIRIVDN